MASTTISAEKETLYSFVTKKEDRKSIKLLQVDQKEVKDADVKFKILKGSLTANNKFYLNFGDKPPFSFFKCYPIVPDQSSLVSPSDDDIEPVNNDNYAHPCVWGIAQVTDSRLDGVEIGTKYRAMLPIGEAVSFQNAKIDKSDNSLLIVDRSSTNPAYNVFTKLGKIDEEFEDLALACSPGTITGFGLNFNLRNNDFYGADAVVVTSASSKVALALAVYLRHNDNDKPVTKKIIGYTSPSNKEFCIKTGLFDEVISYADIESAPDASSEATKTKYVVIDIAGRGDIYNWILQKTDVEIVKLLVVGNSSGTPDNQSTFSSFPMGAKAKMLLTMMGAPGILTRWINPVQELYLIFNDIIYLKKEWGIEKFQKTLDEYVNIFCTAASGKWISIRTCENEESIQAAFSEIVQGSVPPTETIILDVAKAVAHRK